MPRSETFHWTPKNSFRNDKSYFISNGNYDLLGFLNSLIAWWFITGVSPAVRGGFHELRVQYVEKVPIPKMSQQKNTLLHELGERCSKLAIKRYGVQTTVRHRILDLLPSGREAKLTRKLEDWWELDFRDFQAEVKRAFRADIPLKQRNEWESYLAENGAAVRALTSEIENAEREIDAIVYRLFDLTADEITLLESSL